MLNKTIFCANVDRLYAAFNKRCSTATAAAIYDMLGGDDSECDEAFLIDAVNELMHHKRLPDNVGLALVKIWEAWKVGSSTSQASADVCGHCGGRGWIRLYCRTRPGIAPAFVRCVCNLDPKVAAQTAYTMETADRIPGCSVSDPWSNPAARYAWLREHGKLAPTPTESEAPTSEPDAPSVS